MLSFFSFHLDNFVKEARQESVLRRNLEPSVVWLFSAVFTHYSTLCAAFVALLATEGFLPWRVWTSFMCSVGVKTVMASSGQESLRLGGETWWFQRLGGSHWLWDRCPAAAFTWVRWRMGGYPKRVTDFAQLWGLSVPIFQSWFMVHLWPHSVGLRKVVLKAFRGA